MFANKPNNGSPPWIFGLDRASFVARNPASAAENLNPNSPIRIYLDTGEDDPMVQQVRDLHSILAAKEIRHQYQVRPGVHNRTYWEPLIPEYLAFYAAGWNSNNKGDSFDSHPG